jgi:hypothetical protein
MSMSEEVRSTIGGATRLKQGPFYRVTPRSYSETQGISGRNIGTNGQPSNTSANTGANREAGRGVQPLQQELSGGQKVVPPPLCR